MATDLVRAKKKSINDYQIRKGSTITGTYMGLPLRCFGRYFNPFPNLPKLALCLVYRAFNALVLFLAMPIL